MGGKLKALRSAKGVGGHIEAAKGIGETVSKFKDLSATLGKTAAGAKGAAGMFGMLGTAMEMLGKIGWVGLIIAAVALIAKAVNGADKLIKGFNQSFIKMYGPTIALKNVRESMRKFSDAVMDMNRNLKYGINKEEIMGLFDAMSAGGLSLQGIGKRVGGGYNEIIEKATILSKEFGVDLNEMGGMIADQMINLRASMDDVSKSMESMAYDASIAGIKSQKFYEAVTAATDALGYYGNYLSSTSALLKTFAQQGAMPFKDAAKEAQDIMGVFKGMDMIKKMGFIQLVGSEEIQRDQQERARQLKAEEDLLATKIEEAKKEGDNDRAAVLEEEKATKKRQRVNLEAYSKDAKNIQALAAGLDYVPDTIVKGMIKAIHGVDERLDIFDTEELLAKSKILADRMNIPEEALRKFFETSRNALDDARETTIEMGNKFSKIGDESKKGLQEIMSGYRQDIKEGKVIDYDKLKKDLSLFIAGGNDIGISIDDFIKQFEKNAYVVFGAVDDAVLGIQSSEKAIKERTTELMTKPVVAIRGSEERDKRIDKIVKNTMTFEKMIGITKESAEYLAAMKASDMFKGENVNEAIVATARFTGLILDWLLTGNIADKLLGRKPKSGEELKKDKRWNDTVELQKRSVLMQTKMNEKNAKFEKTKKRWEEAKNKYEYTKNKDDKKLMDDAEQQMKKEKKEVDILDKEIKIMETQKEETARAGGFMKIGRASCRERV